MAMPALLAASQLPLLEKALSEGMMGQRRAILRGAMSSGIADLRMETGRVINIRRRDLAEQMVEMRGLRGKNATVINQMRSRIEAEQTEFDASGARIHAVRVDPPQIAARSVFCIGQRDAQSRIAPAQ